MNILALNWQDLKNPLSGGAEVHLEELLRRLVAKGHTVTLFCSNYRGGKPEETVEGVRIIRRGGRYDFNFIAPFHLRKLVKRERFDILIEDINKIPFYTPLYLKIPTLVVIPHLFSTSVFEEINFVLGSYIYLFERPMARLYRGKKFNVISDSTATDLGKRGIPEKDISVTHCGIDESRYSFDESVTKDSFPSVIYLGRIKKYKSVQHLISAIALVRQRVPGVKLTVVGAGDYMDALKKQTDELGLNDCVEFTGFVSGVEKVARLRRAHVCVCPSLKEGWGLTNIEANACGTATIAANVEGLRDSLKDGVSGLLYEHGNIGELAEKIERVLTDDQLRAQLEQGAREWARQFSWDRAADEFMRVVEDTVAYERRGREVS
ncbi:MAG TPA: glycosyltransferase family 4 protein, partial [candidate division Zixibacteria bacterium]|nr:glycosyltransferase family 4 protein [candidate division Zixibacteria bacterium]